MSIRTSIEKHLSKEASVGSAQSYGAKVGAATKSFMNGSSSGGSNASRATNLPKSKYQPKYEGLEQTLSKADLQHPVKPDLDTVAAMVKEARHRQDMKHSLNKDASWEELFEANMQKKAAVGKALQGFGKGAGKFIKGARRTIKEKPLAVVGTAALGAGGYALKDVPALITEARGAVKDAREGIKNVPALITDTRGAVKDARDGIKKVVASADTAAKGASDASSMFTHFKKHKGKYALGAGALASLAAYAMYRRSQSDDEDDEDDDRRKEREIRALNRMARAQEAH
jgi:hypothetical protein